MSFVKGFTGGFGLVQNAIKAEDDREYRADSLAANSRNADALADYRDKTLGIQQQQADNLASYRSENLALQKEIAGMDNQYKTLKAKLDAADDERDDANTAINNQASFLRAQGDFAETTEELVQARMTRDAGTLNNIFALANSSDAVRKQSAPFIKSSFESLEDSPLFPINAVMSTDMNVHSANLQQLLTDVSNGTASNLTTPQLGALTDIMNIGNSASIGQTVSPQTFPAAPREYDGYKVVDITLGDLKSRGSDVVGDVAVELESPDGGSVFYFPKLTEFRGGTSNQIQIDGGEGMQAMLGRTMMFQTLLSNPVFKNEIDNYKVEQRGGEDAVRDQVGKQVDRVISALETNQSEIANQTFIDSNSLQGFVLPGENPQELLKKVDVLTERARRSYLYGSPAESRVGQAQDYVVKLQSLMTETLVDTGNKNIRSSGANSRQTVRNDGVVSLSELVGDVSQLNPNQMAHINAMIDDGDSKTIPSGKYQRLQEYLINQGLMARP